MVTVCQTAPFSTTLNDPNRDFKVTRLMLNISETVILIGTYTRPTQVCHFEWPRVTLSDLVKYLRTWNIARSLCDDWASCYFWSFILCRIGLFFVCYHALVTQLHVPVLLCWNQRTSLAVLTSADHGPLTVVSLWCTVILYAALTFDRKKNQ